MTNPIATLRRFLCALRDFNRTIDDFIQSDMAQYDRILHDPAE